MRWSTASCIALAALAGTLAAPAPAQAAPSASASATPAAATTSPAPATETRRKRDRVRALEMQGLVMGQLLPRVGYGGDLAFAFGHPNFQARVGAVVVGVPAFRIGDGAVANVLQTGTLDLCAAKQVLSHQIRMCMGGQAGGMAHFWKGHDRPGRGITPWAAGTLKADYQVRITKHLGVIGGVGVVIPLVGPAFQAHDQYGSPSPLIFPGPMAGFLSLGTAFRW